MWASPSCACTTCSDVPETCDEAHAARSACVQHTADDDGWTTQADPHKREGTTCNLPPFSAWVLAGMTRRERPGSRPSMPLCSNAPRSRACSSSHPQPIHLPCPHKQQLQLAAGVPRDVRDLVPVLWLPQATWRRRTESCHQQRLLPLRPRRPSVARQPLQPCSLLTPRRASRHTFRGTLLQRRRRRGARPRRAAPW